MSGWLKWALLLGAATALAGCASHTKDRWVHVFFTGVDQPSVVAASIPAPATNAPAQALVRPAEPIPFFHQPFAERKCEACHVTGQSQQLRAEGADLCLGCHDKLIGQAKFVHSPVDDGKCSACHDAHQSMEPALLTRKGRALCFDCHRPAKMEKVKGHADMGTAACQSCHDPHRSDQKRLLRAKS